MMSLFKQKLVLQKPFGSSVSASLSTKVGMEKERKTFFLERTRDSVIIASDHFKWETREKKEKNERRSGRARSF